MEVVHLSTSIACRSIPSLITRIMSQVTASELHTIDNDPSTLAIAQGVKLSDAQRKHVAVVLDLFQAKGTMAKLDDNFTENAVYEDLFASAKNREEVGELISFQAPYSPLQTCHCAGPSTFTDETRTSGTATTPSYHLSIRSNTRIRSQFLLANHYDRWYRYPTRCERDPREVQACLRVQATPAQGR